ncbi:hypothetical protein [Flammeovirga sp. EKP202]|uniref:hypothetical protein n=1 Tax=Flammeovirga sp. EKP202 TaxID=2770592 RepID=UPI00165F8F76|nr:hypothetical protein [Flammeovirga sp. EKP202]MBD0405272.1 hypothetical protein [Flammeovirga sp. EKP202]
MRIIKFILYFILIIFISHLWKSRFYYDKDDVIENYKESLHENISSYNHIIDILSKIDSKNGSSCISLHPSSRQGISIKTCAGFQDININKIISRDEKEFLEKFMRTTDRRYLHIKLEKGVKKFYVRMLFDFENGEGHIVYIHEEEEIITKENHILIGNRYKVKELQHLMGNWYYYVPIPQNYDTDDVINRYKESLYDNISLFNHLGNILSKIDANNDTPCIKILPTTGQGIFATTCSEFQEINLNGILSREEEKILEKFMRTLEQKTVQIKLEKGKERFYAKMIFNIENGKGDIIYIPEKEVITNKDTFILIGNKYKVKTLEHFTDNWYFYEPISRNN